VEGSISTCLTPVDIDRLRRKNCRLRPYTNKIKATHVMVKTRRPSTPDGSSTASDAAAVKQIRFHNPRLTRVGIDVLSLAELRTRARANLVGPQRVDFHILLLVREGRGRHMIDFSEVALRPGCAVFVRPGQVQQWRMNDRLQGHVVLISAEALAPSIARAGIDMKLLALDEWPATARLDDGLFAEASSDIARMRADIARFEGSEIEAAILRHTMLALLLRLARDVRAASSRSGVTREAEIHRLFAHELEAGFHKRLSVLDYAKRIGYSESTLSRACLATVARTAKETIDLRVALEAKRLLVHSQATAARSATSSDSPSPRTS
jgi:AraC-like DNA-binding protein